MRDPDFLGAGVGDGRWRAWTGKLPAEAARRKPDEAACLGHWIVYTPGAHAAISHWLINVCHLRDVPGQHSPPLKSYPEAAYEISAIAVTERGGAQLPSPLGSVDVDRPETVEPLTPSEWSVHFHGVNDALALHLGELVIQRIMSGEVSADSDFRGYWHETVRNTAACLASGRHAIA